VEVAKSVNAVRKEEAWGLCRAAISDKVRFVLVRAAAHRHVSRTLLLSRRSTCARSRDRRKSPPPASIVNITISPSSVKLHLHKQIFTIPAARHCRTRDCIVSETAILSNIAYSVVCCVSAPPSHAASSHTGQTRRSSQKTRCREHYLPTPHTRTMS
jgi:hypothetical protein